MAPMASTLYGAAHGYSSVPSELPSTSYETSTLPRPRRRNRIGKVLAAGFIAATAIVVLTVALSANVTFSRRAAKAQTKVPRVPKSVTDLKAHKFPPADMGVNGTDGHVCCKNQCIIKLSRLVGAIDATPARWSLRIRFDLRAGKKPWTAFTDPMADACNCAKIYEPTNFCSQTEAGCAICMGAWCIHDPLPTATPTSAPTYSPTITSAPTASPATYAPTFGPTAVPIPAPTASPIPDPTASPISGPTKEPTIDRTVGTP